MTFLSSIGAKIGLYAALGALAIGVWLYIGKVDADLSAAKSANALLVQTNEANVAQIAQLKAGQAQVDAAEQALETKLQASQNSMTAREQKYAGIAAQPGQDGKDAPVVSGYFAELRGAE